MTPHLYSSYKQRRYSINIIIIDFAFFIIFFIGPCRLFSRSPSPFAERSSEDGFRRKRPHSPEGGGASDRGTSPRPKGDDGSKESSRLLDFFEPFSPDHSPEHSFDLYDDDIPPAKRVRGVV